MRAGTCLQNLLAVKQAFLRRVDGLRVVSPQRSAGGQRRYSRVEIRIIQQVATMAGEGITMPAIRRIIELERRPGRGHQAARRTRVRLAEVAAERDGLARRLSTWLSRAAPDRSGEE